MVSLRFDFCDFDIGCTDVHLSTHLSVGPSDESKLEKIQKALLSEKKKKNTNNVSLVCR